MTEKIKILQNIKNIQDKLTELKAKNDLKQKSIKLLVVSKQRSINEILYAYEAGITMFGENKAQEAIKKIELLPKNFNAEFHFIGRIQSNKIKNIVDKFSVIQSVDNLKHVELINLKAQNLNIIQKILIQIKIEDDKNKGGAKLDELDSLIEFATTQKNINIKGLMVIPPLRLKEENRPIFKEAYKIFLKYKKTLPTFDTLSMGMSEDFDIAIEEGANLIRIGSAIFN